jgi:hypothetical protein
VIGVAAVLSGAPVNTFDVGVVHDRDPENIEKLLAALAELDAYYRLQPERRFRPNESHLSSPGHQLLTSKFGHIDLLGAVTKQRGYRDLLPDAEERTIRGEFLIKVLKLEMVITLKQEADRDKDRAVLPILRATLAEIQRRKKEADENGPAPPSTTPQCG